jgi:hypothetical protein
MKELPRIPKVIWIVIIILSTVVLLACGGKVKAADIIRTTPGIASPTPTVELAPTASPATPMVTEVPRRRRLENRQVGYSLLYPADWQVTGKVVATEFANDATCESVEVIDFQPPPGSSPVAFILHSLVQICAKPLADSLMLEEFMRQTYGDTFFARFQRTNLAGVVAFQAASGGPSTTIFLQTDRHRIQIVTTVAASPDQRAQRVIEVQEILDRLSFF